MNIPALTVASEAGLGPFAQGASAPILDGRAWWGGLGTLGVMLCLGWILLARLGRWRWADRWLARALAGGPLAALAVLGLGQVEGLILRFPWWILAVAGWLAVGATGLLEWKRNRKSSPPSPSHPSPTQTIERLGRLLIAVWLLGALAPAFCPPLNYDVLEYHLGIVPHVFEAGRVVPIPHVFYTAQPIATEMLYTLAALLEGTPWGYGPGVLQWLLVALGSCVILRLGAALAIPRSWRPLIVFLLLSHPLIWKLYMDCMTDWTGLLYLAGGLWGWRRFGRPWPAAVWMGLMAGAALSAKWTNAGTVAVPLGFLALGMGWRPKGPLQIDWPRRALSVLGSGALCAGAALLVWLPWGIWLAIVQGNPVAPFAADLFPTTPWPPERLDFLIQTHGPLSFFQADYWTNLAGRLVVHLPGVPIVAMALAMVCITLLAAKLRRKTAPRRSDAVLSALRGLAAGIVVAVLLWGRLRHGADRFLAPPLLLSVLVLALGLAWLGRYGLSRFRPATRAMVRGGLISLLILAAAAPGAISFPRLLAGGPFIQHATGRLSRVEYDRLMLGATTGLFEAAGRLPAGSRIVAVNEARRYLFGRPVALASVFDASPIRPAVTGASDAPAIERRLASAGFTHFLYNGFEQDRILRMHTPPGLVDNPAFRAALAQGDSAALARGYWGMTEFAVDPLSPGERAVYGQFLTMMRRRAIWSFGAQSSGPAMWIAPIQPEPTAPHSND